MMRTRNQISLIIAISLALMLGGCFEPPDLSEVPDIAFKTLTYKQIETGKDSLVLKFDVKDGDGDIGLLSEELNPPYHVYNIVVDSRDSIVLYRDTTALPPFYRTVDYSNQLVFFSEVDNRPPFNCKDYYEVTNPESRYFGDTVFINQNEYHNNMHVTFLKKDLATGEFSEIDFGAEFGNACGGVSNDGRIPIFDLDLLNRPLQGTYTYNMVSAGFRFVLSNLTFKIRFYIYDRALNQSNVVETPEYTLADITR